MTVHDPLHARAHFSVPHPFFEQQTIHPPPFGEGLLWLVYFVVLSAMLGLVLRGPVLYVIFRRDASMRTIGLTVAFVMAAHSIEAAIARLVQSQAMYGAIWREGWWVPAWGLGAALSLACALTIGARPPRYSPATTTSERELEKADDV